MTEFFCKTEGDCLHRGEEWTKTEAASPQDAAQIHADGELWDANECPVEYKILVRNSEGNTKRFHIRAEITITATEVER